MIPSVSLYVFKSRVNARGEGKVYVRFTLARKSSYYNTNVSVPVRYWDSKRQRVKPSFELANVTNMLLDKKLSEIRQQLMLSAMSSTVVSPFSAKRSAVKKGNLSFFALSDEYVSDLRKSGKIGTADKLQTIYKKFEQFLGGRSATFYDIDKRVITDYQHHLVNVLKNGMNTVHTNLKSLRRVFSLAVERGYVQSNDDPFKTIKMKGQKTMRPFLTKEEVSAIWALELPSESLIERCRDVFIWTILTGGMRVSDVMTLKKSHIHGEFVETRIKKTNSPHRIKMPKMALKILERYYNAIVTKDGFVFGFLPSSLAVGETDALAMDRAVTSATQKYNGILKDIGKMAGIEKHISSHIARISFITIAISSGVDITTVRGIAGHSDVEMTAHYSKYIDNQGDEALSDLSEKIFSIK